MGSSPKETSKTRFDLIDITRTLDKYAFSSKRTKSIEGLADYRRVGGDMHQKIVFVALFPNCLDLGKPRASVRKLSCRSVV